MKRDAINLGEEKNLQALSNLSFSDLDGYVVSMRGDSIRRYFQSIEKVIPAIMFAFLRGLVFLIPSFLLIPELLVITGIWLSLFVSELLTSICIVIYYLYNHYKRTDYLY